MRYENGFTPMHWAAQHGRRDLVEFIREKVVGAPSMQVNFLAKKTGFLAQENMSIVSMVVSMVVI